MSITTFKEWQGQPKADPEFLAAASTLEISYQIVRLRIELVIPR